ncbi:7-carboxy-7-deazaguanine synthase QueE [Vulcanisaeta souniana]|uniref:7-carboxy-7-deazaguanine synthase n=1 Tax=Vulcanisaeta souniana JCM 11219 TaxID=1293586 RepID=A0A830EI21_9CREN|nr:7-carboxy-7-deazaguanine synthase QueE [Vulcanisaeta souniana]BDR93238.1 7-carboxy-7-deazaguanine synthase [Vulcanisaeta souniana JCM 11219]GGI78660.1 7-carboxy-7-deazaguanine synthase [Vulcanisaeta souniana JCM 11219]
MKSVRVIEIFKSWQGEGPNAGREAVFLRLALCNLRCSWCDTKYSWFGGTEMSVHDVYEALMKTAGGVRHLAVTGGEPLLWSRELLQLLRFMKAQGFFVEVETNGTLRPGELVNYVDEFNVSPKLSNSGVSVRLRVNELAIRDFVMSGKAIFKFVVDKPGDVNEVLWFINKFSIPRDRVYLMSQCTTREECIAKDEGVTKPMAVKLGVNYTPRLHILMGFK